MGSAHGVAVPERVRRRWLYNCHCNGGVFNLGHRHPAVVAAVREALDHLDIGNHHLVSGWRAPLAERLAAIDRRPPARRGVRRRRRRGRTTSRSRWPAPTPGRTAIVSAVGGYHGHTGLSMAAGDPEYRDPFGPNLPGFRQVPFNDLDALDARRRRHDRRGDPRADPGHPRHAAPRSRLPRAACSALPRAGASCFDRSTRCRPGSAAPAPCGASSRRASSPTSSSPARA